MISIVAEVGAAHNGSFERAMQLVEHAALARATHVKFQTWHRMCLPGHVIEDGPWAGRDLKQLYDEAKTPWDWHGRLFKRASELGLTPFSTPFDRESVDFLELIGCPMYKIASAEIIDLPLIRYVASKRKPMVISTGMAEEREIFDAVVAARGAPHLTLLRCVSAYPANAKDSYLLDMRNFGRYRIQEYGLSDHSRGSAVACAAVGLGASMIEKHIGLDRSGPDGKFVATPSEFARFVGDVNAAASAVLGRVGGSAVSVDEESTFKLRRSLWVVQDVRAGDLVTEDNVRSLRPSGGLPPDAIGEYLGRAFSNDVKAGLPFVAGMV